MRRGHAAAHCNTVHQRSSKGASYFETPVCLPAFTITCQGIAEDGRSGCPRSSRYVEPAPENYSHHAVGGIGFLACTRRSRSLVEPADVNWRKFGRGQVQG